jgi:hypothetical protein
MSVVAYFALKEKEFDLIALKQLIRESHYLHTFAAREHEWEAISVQR